MRGEYGNIVILVVIGLAVAGIVEGVSYALGKVSADENGEKRTAYECGFEAFEDARQRFDVRFYIVGMMFIVFDVETSYMIPCSMVMERIGELGYWSMMEFIVELGIGVVYIWRYIEQKSIDLEESDS